MTRTIFKDGNTRIELHGEDPAEGEHTLLGQFEFDSNFLEDPDARFDKHGYLANIGPDNFRPLETAKFENEIFLQ